MNAPGNTHAGERRLRVLHLGKYLPPHPGGIERFLADLMPALRRHRIASAALVHDAGRDQPAGCRRRFGAAVAQAPVAATLAFTPISPGWPGRLNSLIRRWRPDLLHLHLPNPSAFWALALPATRKLPWLVHWHADVPVAAADRRVRLLYRGYRPLETAVLSRAARIVATSQAYAGSSVPLGRWRDKIRVIPLGLPDAAQATPTPALWPEGDGLRLLFVGRFSYYKGLEYLLRALARVDGIRLLLVGTGDRFEPLRRLATELGLEARVRFAGHLDDQALVGAYAAADALCLPSIERSEAFGLVLLEAMRAGVATLATTVPGAGMAEVLAGGDSGLLVAPGDVDALATALARLRDEPAFRQSLAALGQQRFLDHYRIDQVAGQLAGHYRDLVNLPGDR